MKKYLLIFILCLIIIPNISAADWDNTEDYTDDNMTVIITNWFGLGEELGRATLRSHTTVDEIRNVMPGEDRVVMYYDFYNWEEYQNGLGDVTFTNMKTGREIIRDYHFAIATYGEVDVPIYEEVCTATNCTSTQIGTEKVSKIISWEKIQKKDIPAGNVTIGLVTDVYNGDYLDGVWEIAGRKVSRHAVWQSSFEVGLVTYYSFENIEDGTDVRDLTDTGTYPNLNLTITDTSATNYTPNGKVGTYAMKFITGDNSINSTNNIGITGDSSWSMAYWSNITTTGGEENGPISWSADGSQNNQQINIAMRASDTRISILGRNNDLYLTPTGFAVGGTSWSFISIIYDNATSNVSVYVDGSRVATGSPSNYGVTDSPLRIGMGIDPGANNFFNGELDELGIWNRVLTQSEITDLYNGGTGLTYGELPPPTLTLNSPTNAIETLNGTVTFNCSAEDTANLGILNVTLIIDDEVNATVTNTTAFQNISIQYNLGVTPGAHNWSCKTSNSNEQTVSSTRIFNKTAFIQNSQTYNSTTYETATEEFVLNITTNGTGAITAYLWYNNTNYGQGTQTGTDTEALYNFSIDAPLINTTQSFKWLIYMDGINVGNSTATDQTVGQLLLDLCNTTLSTPYLNVTFKNETAGDEDTTATISSTFNYYLGSGTIFKSTTYTNTTENPSYGFCSVPQDRTLYTNFTTTYDNSESQERSYFDTYTLTNSTTNQTLYLLPTSEGLFVSFQVVDSSEQVISDVYANVTKAGTLIDDGYTDGAGLVVFFLDPDTQYALDFYKSGYPLTSITLYPTQTSYTVTLGSVTTVVDDFTRGITSSIQPTSKTLYNDTIYSFNYTLSSSYWTVTEYGFILINSSYDELGSVSDSANGGTVNLDFNTGSQTSIRMNYYYIIDGNYTNSSVLFYVVDATGTGYGLNNFFSRLSTYLGVGMLGADSFSLMLIIYIVIFVSVGVMCYKYGLNNGIILSFIVFTLMYFFDVVLGLVPAIPNTPAELHFATLISLGIVIAMIIKESRT